jgi:hypothetical protein
MSLRQQIARLTTLEAKQVENKAAENKHPSKTSWAYWLDRYQSRTGLAYNKPNGQTVSCNFNIAIMLF